MGIVALHVLLCLALLGHASAQPAPEKLDCSVVLGSAGPAVPVKLGAWVTGEGVALKDEDKAKFQKALCTSFHAGWLLAQRDGEDVAWLEALPVNIVPSDGASYVNANFQRNPLEGQSRSLYLTKGLIETASFEELTWVLGHEIGHGIEEHSIKRWSVVTVSGLTLAGGSAAFVTVSAALWMRRRWDPSRGKRAVEQGSLWVGGAFTVIGALGVHPVSTAVSHCLELSADKFGVEVLQAAGLSPEAARVAAIGLVSRFPQEAGSYWDESWLVSVHPSTEDRIAALRTVK